MLLANTHLFICSTKIIQSCVQVDHLQDEISSIECFKKIQDPAMAQLSDDEAKESFDIMSACLRRHNNFFTSKDLFT